MGNFSTQPDDQLRASRGQGYVAVHAEAGVPVLDRDLNLLTALPAATTGEVVANVIGDGTGDGGFAITALAPDDTARNDFVIAAGTFSAAGYLVQNLAPIRYSAQTPAPPALTPFAAGPDELAERHDLVYLETWSAEVTGAGDPQLLNGDDVGLETSTRGQRAWAVRVAEGADALPSPAAGHVVTPLAQIVRLADGTGGAVERWMVRDLRVSGLSLAAVSARLDRIERTLRPVITRVMAYTTSTASSSTYFGQSTTFQMFGDSFDLVSPAGSAPALTLGGAPVTVVSSSRGIINATIPLGTPPGVTSLLVTNAVGTASRLVSVEERWRVTHGMAYDIAAAGVSAPNGIAWCIGNQPTGGGYTICRIPAAGSPWTAVPGGAVRIACDSNGVAWIVNNAASNSIFTFNPANTSWTSVGGHAVDIAVGARGSVWKIDTTDGIAQWNGTNAWNTAVPLPVPPNSPANTPRYVGSRVAVDPNGNAWVVTTTGQIIWYSPSQSSAQNPVWNFATPPPPSTGPVNDISIGGDGTVWVTAVHAPTGGQGVFSWTASGGWRPSTLFSWPSAGYPTVFGGSAIGAGADGRVWVVDGMTLTRHRDLAIYDLEVYQ